MSEPDAVSEEPGSATPLGDAPLRPSLTSELPAWARHLITVLYLVALGGVGFGLREFTPKEAEFFWVLALPLFGIVSLQLRTEPLLGEEKSLWRVLRVHFTHWSGLLASVLLMLFLVHNEQIKPEASGLLALLLLGLSSFYAGVYVDRSFFLIALLLGVATGLASFVGHFLWIGVGLIVLVGIALLLKRAKRQLEAPPAPAPGDPESAPE